MVHVQVAVTVEQVLVFGSHGCGKTALINSFLEGSRGISLTAAPHGATSHNLVETVQIEDGDLGANSAGSEQIILLREVPAVASRAEIKEQMEQLSISGVAAAASMVLILYCPFDTDSDEYAQWIHAEVSSMHMPHMFLRTKHDLHIAAYGEENDTYKSDIQYHEPPSQCDDAVVEVVSIKENIYGDDEEDILFLHQRVGWAGLNRQLFSCVNGGHQEHHWLSFFTLTRVAMLGLAGFILVNEGPTVWDFMEANGMLPPFLMGSSGALHRGLAEEFNSL